MEKQLKLKNKILKILPKTVSAITVTFQNPTFSPGRDHKSRTENTTRWLKPHGGKGFSGPIISMIPDEARRKSNDGGNGIENQEPTSPKISCMGQIKHKKKQIKKTKANNNKSLPKEARKVVSNASSSTSRDIVAKKRVSTFQRMLFHVAKPKSAGRKSDASATDKAPRVSQMKRFASGRDALANFDWKVQVVQEEIDYYSDEDRVDSDDAEEEDVMIPFSAPILVGGGVGHGCELNLKPRKEINLWKRRTMAPPRPLQLDAVI